MGLGDRVYMVMEQAIRGGSAGLLGLATVVLTCSGRCPKPVQSYMGGKGFTTCCKGSRLCTRLRAQGHVPQVAREHRPSLALRARVLVHARMAKHPRTCLERTRLPHKRARQR